MLPALALFSYSLRIALLAGGIVAVVVAAVDWAVRTRRLNPFTGLSRFIRARVDPRLAGIEHLVIRSGGQASATPWWGVLAYVLAALVIRALADVLLDGVAELSLVSTGSPLAVAALVIRWVFGFLTLALLVRVFSSWIPALARSRWVRWSHGATEWMLRPLRRVLPALGPIDISPIVAYFGLAVARWLVESVLLGVR